MEKYRMIRWRKKISRILHGVHTNKEKYCKPFNARNDNFWSKVRSDVRHYRLSDNKIIFCLNFYIRHFLPDPVECRNLNVTLH